MGRPDPDVPILWAHGPPVQGSGIASSHARARMSLVWCIWVAQRHRLPSGRSVGDPRIPGTELHAAHYCVLVLSLLLLTTSQIFFYINYLLLIIPSSLTLPSFPL